MTKRKSPDGPSRHTSMNYAVLGELGLDFNADGSRRTELQLCECTDCGALVIDRIGHTRWHERSQI